MITLFTSKSLVSLYSTIVVLRHSKEFFFASYAETVADCLRIVSSNVAIATRSQVVPLLYIKIHFVY